MPNMIVAVIVVVAEETIARIVITKIYWALTIHWRFPKRFKYFKILLTASPVNRYHHHPHLPHLTNRLNEEQRAA